MIKNIKKIIGLLCGLALCMAIAVGVPQITKAAETETFNGASGTSGSLSWNITKDGHLTITGEGDYKPVSFSITIDSETYTVPVPEWVKYYEHIRTAEINVRNINSTEKMFYYCINLNSLDLSNLDTSNVKSMYYMFYYCKGLSSINVSNFDTSSVTDMQGMFKECSNLQSLDLSSFNTSNVTTMCYMFGCCRNLQSLELNNFNTSNVTDMDYMFQECNNLQSLNLSSFDTSNVTRMGLMFNNCNNLTNVDLHNFSTNNVTTMYGMFNGCSSLQSLNLSSFDTSNVTRMFRMFDKCSSLQNLDLSSFDTSNVTGFYGMYGMFNECSSLQSLDLSSFDTSNITHMVAMFEECSSLENLDLSSFDTSNVKNMFDMFRGCSNLKNLDLSNFNTNNVTTMRYMFCSCENLSSLNINTFDTSNVTDMYGMFFGCINLENLNLSNFNTENVTNMQNMFAYCWSLSNLDISNFNTSNVTSYFSLTDLDALEKLYFFANSSHEYDLPLSSDYYWINESNETCTKTVKTDKKVTYTRINKNYIPPIAIPSDAHIFSDYNYNNPVTGSAVTIYGNGKTQTIDGKKITNKIFTAYTDILASYKYILNSKGIVKPSIGKVIVGITKSTMKPEVNSRNKIANTSTSKIAKAKIKNGQITVTAVGKESGLVYLWVIDTGNKGVSTYYPIYVKLAPTKLEVQNASGSKLKNTKLINGTTLNVYVAGLVGQAKTEDCTYTATVDSKYQDYVTVTPVAGSTNKFKIKAIGLKNNKDTKVAVTFQCDQNGKKTNLSLTVTK